MAHPTLSALKTQKTVTAATRVYYFPNFTKTESQFKISFLNFFHFFLHHNTSQYIVVLGRRKNPILFWASFGKLTFFDLGEWSSHLNLGFWEYMNLKNLQFCKSQLQSKVSVEGWYYWRKLPMLVNNTGWLIWNIYSFANCNQLRVTIFSMWNQSFCFLDKQAG